MSQQIIDTIIKHQKDFHPVVSFDPSRERIVSIVLTEANTSLTSDIVSDINLFSHYIIDHLQAANARYAIGGYGEHRQLYSNSAVFDGKPGEEPRRLHLGVDIWGKPYSRVMAPLEGIVHSTAFNNQAGDYGATVILTHHLGEISFYTLYGHLSLNSLKNLKDGKRVEAGEVFAEFGIPIENGHWPPHLHFQIIFDIGQRQGDYPGVCKFSERDQWLSNSPDPDIILQLNRYLQA